MLKNIIECWIDGATEPVNPSGAMGYGIQIKENGTTIHEKSYFEAASPQNTSNLAEYKALLAALSWLYINKKNKEMITIRGDSQLVIKQMNGEWQMKQGAYITIATRCIEAKKYFNDLHFEWVSREQNQEADNLSKKKLLSHNIKITPR